MNVFLKGNLAQMPVKHIDALLTPKKKATLPLDSTLFCLISNIAVYCFYEVVNKFPHYDKLKREYKHIYILHIFMCLCVSVSSCCVLVYILTYVHECFMEKEFSYSENGKFQYILSTLIKKK